MIFSLNMLNWVCFVGQYLQAVGLYESQEEAVRREEVLGRLDQVEFLCPSCILLYYFLEK